MKPDRKKTRIRERVFGLLLFMVLAIAPCSILSGQGSGTITGTVTEKNTGDPLPGANVLIEELTMGTITDLEGEFSFPRVAEGSYTVQISFIGYQKQSRSIEITPGEYLHLDFELAFESQGLEEVVIKTMARGQLSAINQQRSADQLKNVVSAERIQDVPDANAAESVSRLPGISLIRSGGEGTNVNIRGLHPKYNNITINGINIPSTSTSDRTTDMSMISSESLSGIEVFKALTPDMPGDAIGGTVNLRLAKAKEAPNRYVRVYGIYNAQEKDAGQYRASGNWSQRLFDSKLGLQASVNSELRNRSSDGLSAGYVLGAPREDGSVPLRLTSASVTDTEEYRKRIGANLILDYSIGKWDLILSNFYNRSNRDIRKRQTAFDASNSNMSSYISNPESNVSLLTNNLEGRGLIGPFEVDWLLSHSYTKNDVLHNTTLGFLQDATQIPIVDYDTINPLYLLKEVVPDSTANMTEAEHSESSVYERNLQAGINFRLPYQLGDKISGELKFGGRYRRNNREKESNEGEWWVYLDNITYPMSDYFDPVYDPGNFLDGQSSIGIVLDPTLTHATYDEYTSNFFLNDYSREHYEVTDQVGAAYLMTKMNIGSYVTFIPGFRYEHFSGDYLDYRKLGIGHGTGIKEEQTAQVVYRDLLPMVHLMVKPANWFDLRMAVTKTLSRPSYNKLLPYLKTDLADASGRVTMGNPDLEETRSWNYDIYATAYHNKLGFLTAGVFYKDMEGVDVWVSRYIEDEEKALSLGLDPVLHENYTMVGRKLSRPENTGQSSVLGFEIDYQTNFWFLPKPFDGFVVSINYTRIWSETQYPYFNVETLIDPTQFPPVQTIYTNGFRSGTLPGQADHLANFMLGYDIGGLSARISMTYQGKSLVSVGTQEEHDNWSEDFIRWDFTLKYSFENYISLFFTGANLNNQYDGSYRALNNRPSSLSYYGPSYELGIQFKF